MSDSISKYFEIQEEFNLLKRRENIHKELTNIKVSIGLIGEKDLSHLEWFLNNREKIVNNQKIIDLIG
jgi:tRNA U34 5-carboxymethylaminomethyl modifying enzyme MnmG/GidA